MTAFVEQLLAAARQANDNLTRCQDSITENKKALTACVNDIDRLQDDLKTAQTRKTTLTMEIERLRSTMVRTKTEARDTAIMAVVDTIAGLCCTTADINSLLMQLRDKWRLNVALDTACARQQDAAKYIRAFADTVCTDDWLTRNPPEDDQDKFVIKNRHRNDSACNVTISVPTGLLAKINAFMHWADSQTDIFAKDRAERHIRETMADEPYRRALYEKLHAIYDEKPE